MASAFAPAAFLDAVFLPGFFRPGFLPFDIAIDPAIFETFAATWFRHPLVIIWTMTAPVAAAVTAFEMEFFRHDHPAVLVAIKIFSFNQLFHRFRL
jgi:hypothetical protein